MVTSVSVTQNGQQQTVQFSDAVGKPVPRPLVPPQVASPINLLNPDRYEFYTFNDNGDLIKRLMTMKEIQSIVAGGASEGTMLLHSSTLNADSLKMDNNVQDIVTNVQRVLNNEVELKKNATGQQQHQLDTPDVSQTWSMILPAIFGNTGDTIRPGGKPVSVMPAEEIAVLLESTHHSKPSTGANSIVDQENKKKIDDSEQSQKPIEVSTPRSNTVVADVTAAAGYRQKTTPSPDLTTSTGTPSSALATSTGTPTPTRFVTRRKPTKPVRTSVKPATKPPADVDFVTHTESVAELITKIIPTEQIEIGSKLDGSLENKSDISSSSPTTESTRLVTSFSIQSEPTESSTVTESSLSSKIPITTIVLTTTQEPTPTPTPAYLLFTTPEKNIDIESVNDDATSIEKAPLHKESVTTTTIIDPLNKLVPEKQTIKETVNYKLEKPVQSETTKPEPLNEEIKSELPGNKHEEIPPNTEEPVMVPVQVIIKPEPIKLTKDDVQHIVSSDFIKEVPIIPSLEQIKEDTLKPALIEKMLPEKVPTEIIPVQTDRIKPELSSETTEPVTESATETIQPTIQEKTEESSQLMTDVPIIDEVPIIDDLSSTEENSTTLQNVPAPNDVNDDSKFVTTTEVDEEPTTTETVSSLFDSDFSFNQIIESLKNDMSTEQIDMLMTNLAVTTEAIAETTNEATTIADDATKTAVTEQLTGSESAEIINQSNVYKSEPMYVDEIEPQVYDIPTTTTQMVPEDEAIDTATIGPAAALTMDEFPSRIDNLFHQPNNPVIQEIDNFIDQNPSGEIIPDSLAVESMHGQQVAQVVALNNLSMAEYVGHAATAASILRTVTEETPQSTERDLTTTGDDTTESATIPSKFQEFDMQNTDELMESKESEEPVISYETSVVKETSSVSIGTNNVKPSLPVKLTESSDSSTEISVESDVHEEVHMVKVPHDNSIISSTTTTTTSSADTEPIVNVAADMWQNIGAIFDEDLLKTHFQLNGENIYDSVESLKLNSNENKDAFDLEQIKKIAQQKKDDEAINEENHFTDIAAEDLDRDILEKLEQQLMESAVTTKSEYEEENTENIKSQTGEMVKESTEQSTLVNDVSSNTVESGTDEEGTEETPSEKETTKLYIESTTEDIDNQTEEVKNAVETATEQKEDVTELVDEATESHQMTVSNIDTTQDTTSQRVETEDIDKITESVESTSSFLETEVTSGDSEQTLTDIDMENSSQSYEQHRTTTELDQLTTSESSDEEFSSESFGDAATTDSKEEAPTTEGNILAEFITTRISLDTTMNAVDVTTDRDIEKKTEVDSLKMEETSTLIAPKDEHVFVKLGETTIQPLESTTEVSAAIPIAAQPQKPATLKIDDIKKPIHFIRPTSDQLLKPSIKRPPAYNSLKVKTPSSNRRPVLTVNLDPAPKPALGLEESTVNTSEDLLDFTKLCNEISFSFWKSLTSEGISSARSLVISPFALTSMLAMVFLGARGSTSGEMNDLLRLDDMVTFNPHLIFRNVTDSVENPKEDTVATSAFVRELFSDRQKGKILSFFKEKSQQYYAAHVEEVNFALINDIVRRRTNLLVKRHTMGRINEYLKTNNVWLNAPLAGLSANVFQTDCSKAFVNERDGEMFFQVLPSIRQRRLIPVPAVVWRSGFTAGYDPELDATAVAFGDATNVVSTIYLMPGQQGHIALGDSLERLEAALMETAITKNAWSRLLTTLIERPGLEVQLPRFSHRSFVNATTGLQRMGLSKLFDFDSADLRGLTGSTHKDLFISDMVQINTFSTCGEEKISNQHHVEMYPAPPIQHRNINNYDDDADASSIIDEYDEIKVAVDEERAFYDPLYDAEEYLAVPLPLRPRQARIPESPRLRFDKPFLFFVRHNPTGMILYMGRFNPRLLP